MAKLFSITNINPNKKSQEHYHLSFISKFLFIQMLGLILNEYCPREKPIFSNNECSLSYCNLSQKTCSVNNTIIKTQWLNNIFYLGEKHFRYISFVITPYGDLFLASSSYPSSSSRIFYGIKKDGSQFFTINGEKNYKLVKNTSLTGSKESKYEAELGFIKTNDESNSEYLIWIGKSKTYTEFLNYNNPNDDFIEEATMAHLKLGASSPEAIIPFSFYYKSSNNTNYYYLFHIVQIRSSLHSLYSWRINYSLSGTTLTHTLTNYNANVSGKRMVSCYMTVDESYIICFISTIFYAYSTFIFDFPSLNSKQEIFIDNPLNKDEDLFYKCIHFKDDVGVFVYYLGKQNENSIDKPNIKLYKIDITNNTKSDYIDGFPPDLKIMVILVM